MTREQFIEQVLIRACVTYGTSIQGALERAESAWSLLHPEPSKLDTHTLVENKARIVAVLESGPIVAVGGLRVRDVLQRTLKARDGLGIQTSRLGSALRALEAEGAIVWSKDHRRLALAGR